MDKNIINIGILAHVDAGKTTLTENMLYASGAIRNKGSVDAGTAITDQLELERRRGISIRTAPVSFRWKNSTINLIDTPGHADFVSEVERSLYIMDGAILVLSAVEGVQSHTYLLWQALKSMSIPTIVVINKIDRQGADFHKVVSQLIKELKIAPAILHNPINEGDSASSFTDLWGNEGDEELRTHTLESLAAVDDIFMERYLEGEAFSRKEILKNTTAQAQNNNVVPILAAVAKNNIGTTELLDAITDIIPTAKATLPDNDLAATVFKVEHDPVLGRLAHIRIFSGSITAKDLVYNHSQQSEMKVATIKKNHTNRYLDTGIVECGDMGILSGMFKIRPGDILGNPDGVQEKKPLQMPVLTIQIHAAEDADYGKLGAALEKIDAEDPNLGFKWYKEDQEMHVTLTGYMRMQVLKADLQNRFGVDIHYDSPTVIYKETPVSVANGFVEYTMPKPCWAVMGFKIAPGARGSGVAYSSEVGVNKIHRKYQNEVEHTIPKALKQGIKGWEVTDINITLTSGEDHEIHSRPGDFILATPMGIMDGLKNCGTKLLEPIYRYHIMAPEDTLGIIAGDINSMRGTIESPDFEDDTVRISGLIPVANSHDYGIRLSSLTKGKGIIRFEFSGYNECPDGEGKERPFKGVNPLDRSQWILHYRGAFKSDDRR